LTLPTRDSNREAASWFRRREIFSDFCRASGGADTTPARRTKPDPFYCHFVLEMFFYVW
jgi:hypothetical protein